VTPSLTKSRKRRRAVNESLLTGNIIIDYVFPLYQGNFNILTGGSNLGQKQTLNSIAYNFLKKNYENKDAQNYVIYITYSKKEALKIQEMFNELGIKENLNQKNFLILNLTNFQFCWYRQFLSLLFQQYVCQQ
jgi:F0F1-type ATP synthase alpha subunit